MSSSVDASQMIISGTDFNVATDAKYAKPKINPSGGKSVGIMNARTNTVLNVSTPLMLTWGINEFTDDKSGKITYDMSLQFPNGDYATPATTKFLANIAAFEEKIKADAIVNSKEWFGKPKMTTDAVEALWTPILKYPQNKDTLERDLSRAPTLRIKVPYWENEWRVELYDMDEQPIFPDPTNPHISPKDLIAKGTNVAVSMQCGGIWFANGKFGVTWKLFQAVVKPKTSLRGKCHIKLTSDDKERLSKQPAPTDADLDEHEDGDAIQATVDTDDEDSAPAPAASKAKIVKKVESVSVAAPAEPAGTEAVAAKKKIVRKA